MKKEFAKRILDEHRQTSSLPSTFDTVVFITRMIEFLFPIRSSRKLNTSSKISREWKELIILFEKLLDEVEECDNSKVGGICETLFSNIEQIYDECLDDAKGILKGDPAASNLQEVIATYPGFYAMVVYRIAHKICTLGVPYLPRMLTEHAHSITGIDIHPGATIGSSFCIDHGSGVVIGETCIIGDNVKVYQGVTLGGLSIKKEMAQQKRHPTIENNVIIYAGTTILGGDTIIGANSTIGGNVWLTESVGPNSFVYYSPKDMIKKK